MKTCCRKCKKTVKQCWIKWDVEPQLRRSLKRSRLVVIDHCATGCLEMLAANVPTILFWNPQRSEIREEAQSYFRELREAGILCELPEEAATRVLETYDAPWSWWGSSDVQRVRRRFIGRYALASRDWAMSWAKALREEVALCKTVREQ